eukprot:TRINITY_DN12305_c0_g2_i12.p2 TRINITY_DN12305_c0_g2~~TRINITY_DN12305_c0_g2_i12.p2  ORF type:complete len:246 (+),score=68.05 TRINITY_DN12305_c0_g2_i12:1135-1872(+)
MAKIAIVTGASRGIGAAIAKLLAQDGYAVAVNYAHNEEKANQVVESIKQGGGKAIAVQANVGDEAKVVAMFERVDKELGTLTALINNAAIIGVRGRVDELSLEDMQASLNTNVLGPMLCSREAVKRMSTKHGGQGGSIVNISSGSAYIGSPGTHVIYGVTKGALNSLTIGLSQEVAEEGIRVNTVSPGITKTDMPGEEAIARLGKSVPMKRAAEPEEIAQAVRFMVSDGASYVAGANLRVGGGRQ